MPVMRPGPPASSLPTASASCMRPARPVRSTSTSGIGTQTKPKCSWMPRRTKCRHHGRASVRSSSTTASTKKQAWTSGCYRWRVTARPPSSCLHSSRSMAGSSRRMAAGSRISRTSHAMRSCPVRLLDCSRHALVLVQEPSETVATVQRYRLRPGPRRRCRPTIRRCQVQAADEAANRCNDQ